MKSESATFYFLDGVSNHDFLYDVLQPPVANICVNVIIEGVRVHPVYADPKVSYDASNILFDEIRNGRVSLLVDPLKPITKRYSLNVNSIYQWTFEHATKSSPSLAKSSTTACSLCKGDILKSHYFVSFDRCMYADEKNYVGFFICKQLIIADQPQRPKSGVPANLKASHLRTSVPSESNPNKTYIVSKYDDGYACSCPHWINRRKECKHIRHVKGINLSQWTAIVPLN